MGFCFKKFNTSNIQKINYGGVLFYGGLHGKGVIYGKGLAILVISDRGNEVIGISEKLYGKDSIEQIKLLSNKKLSKF